MGIVVEENVFHLMTKNTSYVMTVNDSGVLCHNYYGNRIWRYTIGSRELKEVTNLDDVLCECSMFGTGDYREPMAEAEQENGSMTNELTYKTSKLIKGKPSLKGLPATYQAGSEEVMTLVITLEDIAGGLEVDLSYSVFPEHDVITRHATYRNVNKKNEKLRLHRALSMLIDFDEDTFELLQLSGAWAKEKTVYKRPLVQGMQGIDSKRGFSSAEQNPFIALVRNGATEDYGEVYGFNLVYSGNFLAMADVNSLRCTRIIMGINPFQFGWNLETGDEFETPEVVLVHSAHGYGEMSRIYHRFYRDCLCRGNFQYKERPILINNWEATYFNFTEEKLLEIAKEANGLGCELFVLDDGWFGHRDKDNSSLGDWTVYSKKLPKGLNTLAEKIGDTGMRFGLWFEPEMVSVDSDLYRAHPDWCIHVPERKPKSTGNQRNQLVLDLSRNEVCDYIVSSLSKILSENKVGYVKWDCNRAMTDIGSESLTKENQRAFYHSYMLGLYSVLDRITKTFPDVLFESCASGGARFDPGMLYYMPQTWTSDDTDAVERIKIQYGTSLVYPPVTMSCHVSACPNHQVGRITSLKTRGNVAMCGNFGYELDVTKFTDAEKTEVKDQINFYKEIRHIIQFGDLYRCISPYDANQNEAAYCYVTPDKKQAVAFAYTILSRPNTRLFRLKLKGLNPECLYHIEDINITAYGDELMNIGLERMPQSGDFNSWHYVLRAVERC